MTRLRLPQKRAFRKQVTIEDMKQFTQPEMIALHNKHAEWLDAQSAIVGHGVGLNLSNQLCLEIYHDVDLPAPQKSLLNDTLAQQLAGVPFTLEPMQEIRGL